LLQAVLNFFKNLLQNLVGTLRQMISTFLLNPVGGLVFSAPLLLFAAYEVISPIATYVPLLTLTLSLTLGFGSLIFPLGEIAPIAAPVAGGVPLVIGSTAQSVWPVTSVAPTVASPAGVPASTAAAGAGAPAAPAPAAATASFAYMVGGGGDPETGLGPTLGGRGGVKAPAATIPAAAAAVTSRAEARARCRRRAAMRQYGDEFLDMDSDIGVPPDYGDQEQLASAIASGTGAGMLGFAGTAHKDEVQQVAGLTKLAGDEFGGPRMPMVPGTWDQDSDGPREPDESGRGGRDG
jgi:PPE-PPW subfamily C-terminal region